MIRHADILAAAARIAPYALRTPVKTSAALDALSGAQLFFKCENLQVGGAFKFRGAVNAVFALSDAHASHGVITHSSGNHGAALARAAVLAPSFHFLVLYGVSANSRAKWGGDQAARAHIGFTPRDNAEDWAAELADKATPPGSPAARFHGGGVCEIGFQGDPDRLA